MDKKKLYILLTRFPDNGTKVLEAITGCYYAHASIGLEEDPNIFYSFVCKGFIVEEITRYLKPGREPFPCQVYELEVSERAYQRVKKLLMHFVQKKRTMRYTRFGLVLSVLRIPYKRRHHYFCSQFVAEILTRSRAVRMKKNSALYLPSDLRYLPGLRLRFQGNMQSMLQHFAIPCAV